LEERIFLTTQGFINKLIIKLSVPKVTQNMIASKLPKLKLFSKLLTNKKTSLEFAKEVFKYLATKIII
jgi:hypothetical protein